MSDYTPISCDIHSELELLAMRRTRISFVLTDGNEKIQGIISDFKVEKGAEYLVLDNGESIRLDRIKMFMPHR